jgi:phenylalanyl-tRNA synthetase beta chain
LPLKPGEKEPFVIKERKVFGVTSQGMMCSNKELGLGDDAEGIIILPADAKVGQPFAEHLGRSGGDVVYDLEVTPNRPDLNSVIGIAREIAAVTGNPVKLPEMTVATGPMSEVGATPGTTVDNYVAVRIEDADLCPRYTARVVTGVKVGPSPDWLRSTLEKVGIRSINNVVDATNYVMLEIGQPLHAFDYHLIAGTGRASSPSGGRPDACPTIIVRRAQDGELFTTLDGQKRTLTSEMLLIADEQKGIALAGVMGGQNTEINEQTRDVLIESAYFNPTNIRRTSKALGLRSESSYRFERGADIGIADWASRRCGQLILQTAGGQLVPGVVDAHPLPIEPRQITLRHRKVTELLGVGLRPGEMEYYLGQLGLKGVNRRARPMDADAPREPVTFNIPTFRVDLKREVDLIEEIARLHGVDRIPATPPRGAIGANEFDAVYDQIAEVRHILTGLGLNEAQGQTLISNSEFQLADLGPVELANPLSSDMNALRPSLLPGLLDALRHNISRKNGDVALFEIGRVFIRGRDAGMRRPDRPADRPHREEIAEERRVATAVTGRRSPSFWSGAEREARYDAYDLKGLLEEFLEHFGLRGVVFTQGTGTSALFLESASVTLGGKLPLGAMGQLLPSLARNYDLHDPVFLAELDLDRLLARRSPAKSFKPLPQFPSIRRDVAMLVPETVSHEAVLIVVKQTKPANLESVELFDVFRGPAGRGMPEGRKSLAYAFTYRAADRTLTDSEVNAEQEKLTARLIESLGAIIR